MKVPVVRVLYFLRACQVGNDESLGRLDAKFDNYVDSELLGSVESIAQASRHEDNDRLRNEIRDLFKLSRYYKNEIEKAHAYLDFAYSGGPAEWARIPYDLVAHIPIVRKRDIPLAVNSTVIKICTRGLTCITYLRLAEIAKLVCYTSLDYSKEKIRPDISTSLAAIRSTHAWERFTGNPVALGVEWRGWTQPELRPIWMSPDESRPYRPARFTHVWNVADNLDGLYYDHEAKKFGKKNTQGVSDSTAAAYLDVVCRHLLLEELIEATSDRGPTTLLTAVASTALPRGH